MHSAEQPTLSIPAAAPTGGRASRAWLAVALLITLAGLGLRLFHLTGQSLWTDEVSSIDVARTPLNQIWQQSAEANNSLPTYFLLLRGVIGQTGTDIEWRARALSALAGTLSIPLCMALVYLWRRQRSPALLAGVLLACNPLHLWYSQEVRAYAVLLCLGLLSLVCFELARAQRRLVWWVLYIVSAVAAIAIHKTGLVFPAVCILWHGWSVRRERQRLRPLLAHLPVVLAGLVVLLLKSYPPGEGYGRRSSPLEIVYTFMTFVGGYSFGPSLNEIQSLGPFRAVSQHLVQVALLGGVLLLVVVAGLRNWRRLASSQEFLLLVLPVGVVAAYALVSHFPYNTRYTLAGLLGFLMWLAAAAADAPPRTWARISLGAVLALQLWADAQWFYTAAYRKGDSRAVAQWLVQNRDQVHSWTVLPGYLSRSVEWYLQGQPQVLQGDIPAREDRTTSFPPLPDALILGRRHHIQEPDKLVATYEAAAGAVEVRREFTGFEIYQRRFKTPAAGPLPAP